MSGVWCQLNGLGQRNDGALCQEFLRGTEFVIDGVSRDGVYKVVAIWQYDKRCVLPNEERSESESGVHSSIVNVCVVGGAGV